MAPTHKDDRRIQQKPSQHYQSIASNTRSLWPTFTNGPKFILQHEPYNREYYTGYLGELNIRQETFRAKGGRNQENKSYRSLRKTTELFVNLRCMKLVDDKATLFVGGGITKDSVPDDEWQETIEKSTTMLRILLP